MRRFEKGDVVSWITQGRGSEPRKITGVVAAVLKPLQPPGEAELEHEITSLGFVPSDEGRKELSYLVAVQSHAGYRLYWPYTRRLLKQGE